MVQHLVIPRNAPVMTCSRTVCPHVRTLGTIQWIKQCHRFTFCAGVDECTSCAVSHEQRSFATHAVWHLGTDAIPRGLRGSPHGSPGTTDTYNRPFTNVYWPVGGAPRAAIVDHDHPTVLANASSDRARGSTIWLVVADGGSNCSQRSCRRGRRVNYTWFVTGASDRHVWESGYVVASHVLGHVVAQPPNVPERLVACVH